MNLLFVLGTRPEVIKLAPIISLAKKNSHFRVTVCSTGQHVEMLAQTCTTFNLAIDINLNILQKGSLTLAGLTAEISKKMSNLLSDNHFDFIIVQGDTTTAFVSGLIGFYHKIKVAHVEAGLRSFDKQHPFPEELNRKLLASIADLHFAPSQIAKENLIREGVDSQTIFITGNTVIDAITMIKEKLRCHVFLNQIKANFSFLDSSRRLILVTAHRRENHGENLLSICQALKELAKQENNLQIVYLTHLNPMAKEVVYRELSNINNIIVLNPIGYAETVYLLSLSILVVTDSGGLQEEASVFSKPVLILRETTERIEGVHAGIAKIIGTNKQKIITEITQLLNNDTLYKMMSKPCCLYGDGKSSERILAGLLQQGIKKRFIYQTVD